MEVPNRGASPIQLHFYEFSKFQLNRKYEGTESDEVPMYYVLMCLHNKQRRSNVYVLIFRLPDFFRKILKNKKSERVPKLNISRFSSKKKIKIYI